MASGAAVAAVGAGAAVCGATVGEGDGAAFVATRVALEVGEARDGLAVGSALRAVGGGLPVARGGVDAAVGVGVVGGAEEMGAVGEVAPPDGVDVSPAGWARVDVGDGVVIAEGVAVGVRVGTVWRWRFC